MPTVTCERIPYARVDDRNLDLLVWRPAGDGPWPGLLDLHGGYWTYYAPEVDFYLCRSLAERGLVVAAVDFRMAPADPWPTPLADIRAAARFFRHHAARFDVDPSLGIGVIGGSSGGHLAAMLALVPEGEATAALDTPADSPLAVDWAAPLWPILDPPARLAMAQTANFGPLVRTLAGRQAARAAAKSGDPRRPEAVATLKRLDRLRQRWPRLGDMLGRLVQDARARWFESAIGRALLYQEIIRAQNGMFPDPSQAEEASPVALLRRGEQQATPPMLIVHGLRDTNMTVEMTEDFVTAYRSRGGTVEVRYPPDLGHAFGNVPARATDELADAIAGFAKQSAGGPGYG